jgi:hypothetical protein
MVTNACEFFTNALANLANACKCLCECLWTPYKWNDYTSHAWRIAYKHFSNVSLCHLLASHAPPNPLRMLRMLTTLVNVCECPCESCERLRLLTKILRKQWEYDIRQEFRNMFLNYVLFATPHKWPRMLTNTYECLTFTLRSLRIGVKLHS